MDVVALLGARDKKRIDDNAHGKQVFGNCVFPRGLACDQTRGCVRSFDFMESACSLVEICSTKQSKQCHCFAVLSKKLSHYSTAKNINFDVTFADAKRLLRDDFGYALVKIDPGKPVFANDSISSSAESAEGTQQTDLSGGEEEEQNGRAKTRKGSAVHYILVNTAAPQGSYLNCGKKDHLYDRDADPMAAAKLTMLTLTLLYIFMEGMQTTYLCSSVDKKELRKWTFA